MLSHILLHCSDALCMKLRIYKGKHDKYCTSFTLFFNNLYCMNCIYNVVVVVVVVENKFQFNSIHCIRYSGCQLSTMALQMSRVLSNVLKYAKHFQLQFTLKNIVTACSFVSSFETSEQPHPAIVPATLSRRIDSNSYQWRLQYDVLTRSI